MWHITTVKYATWEKCPWSHNRMFMSSHEPAKIARFSRVSEMWQNQASFAMCLSIIWRNELNTVKYRRIWLNATGKRA